MAPGDARFLLALSSPLAPLAGYRLGDNFHAFWIFFLVIPLLDLAIGKRGAPSQAAELRRLESSGFFAGHHHRP